MDLSEILARICVENSEKRAADPAQIRQEFEGAARKEQLLRQHATHWNDLAASRAADEDTSAGGYANTALERAIPVPHTGGEALVRGGLALGGGIGGYMYGKKHSPLDAGDLKRVFSPTGKDQPMRHRLHELLKAKDPTFAASDYMAATSNKGPSRVATSPQFENLVTHLSTAPKEQLQSALHTNNAPSWMKGITVPEHPGASATRSKITGLLGESGINAVRGEAENAIKATTRTGKDTLLQAPKHFGWRGALGGAAIGTAVGAVPYVLRALWQKHQGGEAAVRARNLGDEATGRADELSQKREGLLNQLPKTAMVRINKLASDLGVLGGALGVMGGAYALDRATKPKHDPKLLEAVKHHIATRQVAEHLRSAGHQVSTP